MGKPIWKLWGSHWQIGQRVLLKRLVHQCWTEVLGSRKGFYHHSRLSCEDSSRQLSSECGNYTILKTLTLIMFSNLYPLSNTSFINIGRAQFLCDLIKGTQIDICAHIFQTMGKMERRLAARMCLPFCSLVMKIMVLKGVHPPKEGTILLRNDQYPWCHSNWARVIFFAERAKQSPSRTPKSDPSQHATPFEHRSPAPIILGHPETIFSDTLEP